MAKIKSSTSYWKEKALRIGRPKLGSSLRFNLALGFAGMVIIEVYLLFRLWKIWDTA